MNESKAIRVHHNDLGPGTMLFTGVGEVTDGLFSGDDPAVYALLPAGMPESFSLAVFVTDDDRVMKITASGFAYGYDEMVLWISFINGENDPAPEVFRILDFGKAAA